MGSPRIPMDTPSPRPRPGRRNEAMAYAMPGPMCPVERLLGTQSVRFNLLSDCASIYLSICLSVCLYIYLNIYLFYLSIYLFTYLSTVSICLSICLSVYLSIYPGESWGESWDSQGMEHHGMELWDRFNTFYHGKWPFIVCELEHGHRNSECSHEKWWFSIVM